MAAMSPADTIARLPAPPPAGVSARADGSRLHIDVRAATARWLHWTAGLGCLPAFLTTLVLIALVTAHVRSGRLLHGPLLAGEIVALAVVVPFGLILFALFASALARGQVVFDGQTLFVEQTNRRFALPAGAIADVRVWVSHRRALDFDPALPPGRFIARRPAHAVEVRLRDGRLRFFRTYGAAQVRWVADALRAALGLPGEAPLVTARDDDDGRERDPDGPAAAADMTYRLERHAFVHVPLWLGLLIAAGGGWFARLGIQSHDWPSVDGRVLESNVFERRNDSAAALVFGYTYHAGGTDHTSDHVGYGRDLTGSFVESHPAGAPVRVYYDPAEPARSVLVPGAGAGVWFFVVAGSLLVLLSIPMMRVPVPTPAQLALLRRYRAGDARPGAALGVTDDADDVIRWDLPADLAEREVRHWRRSHGWMSARAAALSVAAVGGLYAMFGPFLPPRLWWMLAAVAGGFAALLGAPVLLVRVRAPGRPLTYRLSAAGIEVPRRDAPLWTWEQLADFRLEPHPLDPATRVALFRAKGGGAKALRLPLPGGDAGDRAVRAIRERLPEVKNPDGDFVARHALSDGWLAFGLLLAVAVGGIGGEVASRHAADLWAWRRVVLLVALVAGPGTWWALCVRARFGRAPVRFVALVFNFVALVAGVLWHLRRSIPVNGE
jgi:hypothetical protein